MEKWPRSGLTNTLNSSLPSSSIRVLLQIDARIDIGCFELSTLHLGLI